MPHARPHPLARSLIALALAAGSSSYARSALPLPTPVRLSAQQVPDASFGQGGVVTTELHGQSGEEGEKVTVMSDGRIVVATVVDNRTAVARYLADGTPDVTFGTGGQTVLDLGYSLGLGVLPDGRIVLAGNTQFTPAQDVQVIRLRPDGQLDPTFGRGGVTTTDLGGADMAFDLAIQPDGRVVVAARAYGFPTTSFFALRYTAGGQLDTTFGQGGIVETPLHKNAQAERVRIDALGRIVLAGNDTIETGLEQRGYAVVARYLPNGAPDPTFGQGGVSSTAIGQVAAIHALDIQPDGRIVVGGAGFAGFMVVRLDAQGTPDWTFGGGDGVADAGPDFGGGHATGLVVRRNGKVLVAGTTSYSFSGPTVFQTWGLAQFNPDGTPDTTFGDHGHLDVPIGAGSARDIALQGDGRAVVVGSVDPNWCDRNTMDCASAADLGLARFVPTDGDASTPPTAPAGVALPWVDRRAGQRAPPAAAAAIAARWWPDGDRSSGSSGQVCGSPMMTVIAPYFGSGDACVAFTGSTAG